ncbi:hypothetical protein PMZ80_003816 [Knufia obscura]|uniref:Aminoglycoside phosphotransferase domain-containing protein n=2 Tax=Knufia TaxID=430999 RepID=A0AAN8ISJ7_9EURO|nr:hypothetical protein PMZ80_003816 [Knufia obscura]KAK5958267.1 hypothetical protein OHC33_000109 [Knufia fluminis]
MADSEELVKDLAALSTSRSRSLSSSSTGSDGVSETSTLTYTQEPYETYQQRVRELVQSKWPDIPSDQIVIERMHGGWFNRVTGFSIRSNASGKPREYVLRNIRQGYDRSLISDLAPLQFLYKYSDLPVPKLVSFDGTEDNPIGRPYIIQERAPGSPILAEYPGMSHECRLNAARQLGHFIKTLTSTKGGQMGKLVPVDADSAGPWTFTIESLEDAGPAVTQAYSHDFAEGDMYHTLQCIFQYRLEDAAKHNEIYSFEYNSWFLAMTNELGVLGYLTDVPITLCHLDFEPPNIIADPTNEQNPISAILDWDSAIFAPTIMSCTPPMWLWAWKDNEDEDEREANDTPSTTENQEIKKAFEQAAGPLYQRFAYHAAYRLARHLIKFALYGM